MKIAIIGQGAIASYVRQNLPDGIVEIVRILRPGTPATGAPRAITSISDLPDMTDLVVDCAGHGALAAHGPAILARGTDVLTVSIGALADQILFDRLQDAARTGAAKLHLATGAIGGLDALRAACTGPMQSVTYTGRKPPAGWQGSPAEDILDLAKLDTATTHFSGTARQAAIAYPKNANVAAAVALAGIGLDATWVELIADPDATGNTHEIRASGQFGELQFHITGSGLPDNPRSSALAAMSVISALAERQKNIVF